MASDEDIENEPGERPRFRTDAHGPAIVQGIGDRMDAVLNCCLPDGTRGTVCRTLPTADDVAGRWRRPLADGSWQVGEIEISPDDVRFIDAQEPARPDAKGDWVVNERGRRVWHGPLHRGMACGVAVVEYLLEDAEWVVGCLFQDGTRGTVLAAIGKAADGKQHWRRPMPDGSWRDGQIDIRGDDVRFIEEPARPPHGLGAPSPEDSPDLEMDMMASPRIAELVRKERFAKDLYRALCETSWFRNGHEWGCTWRQAGGVVAHLRDLNEDYIDFYCSGGEGDVSDEVAWELATLGWTWKPYGGG